MTLSNPIAFIDLIRNDVGGVNGLSKPNDIAITPDGKFLYVSSYASSAVTIFTRQEGTGALTYVGKVVNGVGGVTTLSAAFGVDVSPDGKTLYVASPTSNAVTSFSIDASTGLLTLIDSDTPTTGVAGIVSLSASPDGKNVYAVGGNLDGLVVYVRDPWCRRELCRNSDGAISGIKMVSDHAARSIVSVVADACVSVFQPSTLRMVI